MKVSFIGKIPDNLEDSLDSLEKLLNLAANKLGVGESDVVEISFVSALKIKRLNQQYRQINSPTDVLSFPQAKTPAPLNVLGTIVVAPSVVAEKKEGMINVLLHGLLHLAGFDHEVDEKAWDEAAKKIGCKL
ncbi:MAG: rRNA maturation RNase YbeY [Patescibacteria group bacterium]